jgi:N-acetylmuramic acid 6-phosphate etherase
MTMDRSTLSTERPNPRSRGLDRLSSLGVVDSINREDRLVAPAVGKERRRLAAAVELVVQALRGGGRLFYVGAGTSGRLGVLDASECPPTFGTRRGLVQGVIAGGHRALVRSIEGAEDDAAAGRSAMDSRGVGPRDAVVGIAACGLTPFVRAAVGRARRRGAATIFLTCSPQVRRGVKADVVLCPRVGPEVVAGSTRMKAGTATKLVLNTLSTAAMVRLGKVYGNLMVDLRAVNAKLRDRAARIVQAATGLSRPAAGRLLARASGEVKTAIVMHRRDDSPGLARRRLGRCGGFLRRALEGGA